MATYRRDVLVTTLVHHTRTATSACSCGGVGLGRSWAKHIADVYENFLSGGTVAPATLDPEPGEGESTC